MKGIMSIRRVVETFVFYGGLISAGCLVPRIVLAQSVNLLEECHKIQAAYKKAPFLSYELTYSYTPEKKQDSIYFSGRGYFKMNESNYYGIMDSTLYLQNNRYAVIVSKAERLIHISKSDSVFPMLSSLAVFDSMVQTYKVKYSVIRTPGNKQIVIDFSTDPGLGYKDFRMDYDPASFLIKMISFTRLSEEDEGNQANRKYITAKSVYSNYSTKPFDKTVFNSDKYFVLSGNEYQAQSPFEGYEIFIASPELIKN